MRKLTILVDMDDTIEDLSSAWVGMLNRKYGTNVAREDVVQWDYAESFPSLTREQVYEPLLLDELWDDVKPISGAATFLSKLIAEGHKVIIVTASHYKTLPAKMENVLFRYFPFLRWDDVVVTLDKQLLHGDVLVDDAPHNLEGGNYAKLLFDAPHNRSYDAESNGMKRVKSWKQAYEEICRLAEKGA